MMFKTSAIALISVTLATTGQLLLRTGMEKVGYIGAARLGKPGQLVMAMLRTPQVLAGLVVFAVSAAIWLIVLSRVPLSFAYPFVGLTYLLTTLFAKFILDERVPGLRWAGLAMIIAGILIVGATSPPEPKSIPVPTENR
ncbi:MAG: EamA family transporter [Actinomycetota bacterium]